MSGRPAGKWARRPGGGVKRQKGAGVLVLFCFFSLSDLVGQDLDRLSRWSPGGEKKIPELFGEATQTGQSSKKKQRKKKNIPTFQTLCNIIILLVYTSEYRCRTFHSFVKKKQHYISAVADWTP